jgi:transcription initiation factor TFIIIB Brf1 subunit/transcription initiation factor TFIIB
MQLNIPEIRRFASSLGLSTRDQTAAIELGKTLYTQAIAITTVGHAMGRSTTTPT